MSPVFTNYFCIFVNVKIKQTIMKTERIKHLLMLVTCLLVMLAVAINRDGKYFGKALKAEKANKTQYEKTDTVRTLDDGTVIVNTSKLGKDIIGYGGQVPLDIYIKDGKVSNVKALKNSETPDFFSEAAQILNKWNGKTTEEALALKVDAVSGATLSSRAIMQNMKAGLLYAQKNAEKTSFFDKLDLSAKSLIGLIVVVMAAVIPLFTHNIRYRILQLLLNVVVLGFWCGTFISYSLMVNYLANGINLWTQLIPAVMLITAFIYPLFGRKNYYCTHICPYGSIQELAGKTNRKKLKMSRRTVKLLENFRKILWFALMLLMLAGVLFEWMDYEIFTAFIFESAPVVVITLAVVFVMLSVFIPRPYCRFVCPTGTLFKYSQNLK